MPHPHPRSALAGMLLISLSVPLSAQPREGNQAGPREGGANASAEQQAGPPVKAGRITDIEQKGRVTTLKIESTEGETYAVKLTPLINFFIQAPGDKGFIRPGVYIEGRGPETNDKVFLSEVTVYLLPKGKRAPIGKVVKAQAESGESQSTYQVSGQVTAAGPAEDYPDYTALGLKVSGRAPPVWIEPNCQITVASSDPAHTAVGADLQMAMKPLRGGRMLPTAVRVVRETPFDSSEIFGETDE